MKYLIFVTWLYFQTFLVQCDIFVNDLDGSGAQLKMCMQKTINHLFSENDTLSLILSGSDLCEDAIFEMNTTRPYMVLNLYAIKDVNKLRYDGRFIICPRDVNSLYHTIHNAIYIAVNNNRTLGNSKILVITNITNASLMFEIFWSYCINNVIILIYGQGISKLFMCNPFTPENECGKTPKLMIHQDCEEQLSLSFTSVIHQMNKCPVAFGFEPLNAQSQENYPPTRTSQFVIEELSHHLNATFQRTVINNWREYFYLTRTKRMIVIRTAQPSFIGFFDVTGPLDNGGMLWLVPKARQISNMDVCLKVFNYDVWIATSVVFICVALIWCFIISRNGGFTFDKLCISFLNVWSLTIFGNVARVPRSLAIHILLLFYLIYAINIQFAFTSDMSTVLIAPQYEFQIQNLEALADSQLPVYTLHGLESDYFELNMTDRKLYTKLQNLIYCVSVYEFFDRLTDIHLHRNYTVLANLEYIRNAEIVKNKTIEAYKITDSVITPTMYKHFFLPIDHYFTTTLNTFISKMVESGIRNKRKNDFYREGFGVRNVDTPPEDDLLTLKHLAFIFVFLGCGLCTACVVFCFELVVNKYL